jgi:hypothetical protein
MTSIGVIFLEESQLSVLQGLKFIPENRIDTGTPTQELPRLTTRRQADLRGSKETTRVFAPSGLHSRPVIVADPHAWLCPVSSTQEVDTTLSCIGENRSLRPSIYWHRP